QVAYGDIGYRWNPKTGGRFDPLKGELAGHTVVKQFLRTQGRLYEVKDVFKGCGRLASLTDRFTKSKWGPGYYIKYRVNGCLKGIENVPLTAAQRQKALRQAETYCNHTLGA